MSDIAFQENISMIINDACYEQVLSKEYYKKSIIILCKGGTRMKTKKRMMTMYQFGGTIGAARYPLFLIEISDEKEPNKKFSMLPRPVVKSRPGECGHTILKYSKWLNYLVRDIASYVFQYLYELNNELSKKCLHIIKECKKIIPKSLRICDSFFTQMIILRIDEKEKEHNIPIHIDTDDYVNAILTLGDISEKDGNTVYYNGTHKKSVGRECLSIPFLHGRLQIGFFDKIYHGVKPWTGDRVTISFSLQKKIFNHFVTYGSKYYDQYVDKGYPSKHFIAS